MKIARAWALGLSLLSLAGPAWTKDPSEDLAAVLACRNAADHPICLLRVAARADAGSMVWRDADLRAHPDLLAKAGITREGVQRYRDSDEMGAPFFGPDDQATAAVASAVAKDRAGAGPAEALIPILALPMNGPPVGRFFSASGRGASPRTLALIGLLMGEGETASPRLLHAAAETLAAMPEPPPVGDENEGASLGVAVAVGYGRAGDEAAMRAALARLDPASQAAALLAAGRLREAAARASSIDVAAVRAAVTARDRRMVAAVAERDATAPQEMIAAARQIAAEARANGDKPMAELAERELKAMMAAPPRLPPPPKIRDDAVRESADRLIGAVRADILRAGTGDRVAEVRPLADALLAEPDLIRPDQIGLTVKDGPSLADLARAATPATAAARLDAVQAVVPRKGGDQLVRPLAQAWTVLQRADRLAALEAQIRPAAAAEIAHRTRFKSYAYALFELLLVEGRTREAEAVGDIVQRADGGLARRELVVADVGAGHGLGEVDRLIAAYPGEASTLADGCMTAAQTAHRWDDFLACYERYPYPSFSSAVSGARVAAQEGRSDLARRVLERAAQRWAAAVAADPTVRERGDSLSELDLKAIAKAELQADGRLPKTAP